MVVPRSVAILGAGMGGLAAAHELAKLGMSVDVYEATDRVGGKAKSQSVPDTGTGGRSDLPGEHGFRFYPRFYQHVIASMAEIPDPLSPTGTVKGNLVGTTQSGVAMGDQGGLVVGPRHPKDLLGSLDVFRRCGVSATDVWRYLAVHLKYLTACEERRVAEYEPMSWVEFIRADDPARYSPRYRDIIVSVTRTMVAMDARRGSARTVGNASCLLLLDPAYSDGEDLDRTMTGPTTDVWLEPWREHLERMSVRFHFGARVEAIHCDGRRVTGVDVRAVGASGASTGTTTLHADEYVAALPLEVLHRLLTPALGDADPSLGRLAGADLSELTAWMVGAQFFLRRDLPLCDGHVFFPSSEWALTAISQAQFWNRGARGMSRYGDGRLGGILSIDVSDSFAADRSGLMLSTCRSNDEALDSIWEQVRAGFGERERRALDGNVFARNLDQEVRFGPGGVENTARLLVHPPGSRQFRPEAKLAIDNLSLAADFVATGVDLASMEGANEAGRRAARAIAERAGLDASSIAVFDYPTQTTFGRARALDGVLYRAGLPHVMEGVGPFGDEAAGRVLGSAMSLRDSELVTSMLKWAPRFGREGRRSPEAVSALLRWFGSLPGRRAERPNSVPPSFRATPTNEESP